MSRISSQTPIQTEPSVAKTAPAVAPVKVTEPSLASDSQVLSQPARDPAHQAQLKNIQANLSVTNQPDPAELKRLLSDPKTRVRLGQTLARQPELSKAILSQPGGDQILKLLQTPRLDPAQVKQIQRFAIEALGQDISYQGSASGIDGEYGQRTHQALLSLFENLSTESPADTSAPPVQTPEPSADQALISPGKPEPKATTAFAQAESVADFAQAFAELPSAKQAQLRQQAPELIAQLKQVSNQASQSEIKALQTLLKQTGHDLSYAGNRSGVDGDFGPISRQALQQELQKQLQVTAPEPPPVLVVDSPATTQPPATPPPVSPTEKKPPTTVPVEVPVKVETPVAIVEPKVPTAPDQTALALKSLQGLSAQTALEPLSRQLLSLPEAAQSQFQEQEPKLYQLLVAASKAPLSKSQAINLQTQLVQSGQKLNYPGHATGIDGNPGQRSRQALLNRFQEVLSGQTIASQKSGPFPQYDRMLDDNLLDMTVAIGYDEGDKNWASSNLIEEVKMEAALSQRGFKHDNARALALLKEAGQTPDAEYSAFYVKESVQSHNGKPVHAIVRLIKAGDGQAGQANRKAAIEGMNQSDVFMYGGHARFGSGIDFDRNFTVTVDWEGVANAPAQGKVTYSDYHELKTLLGDDNASAIQWMKRLESAGKMTVNPSNDGNIRMSEKNLHPAEFGAHLMQTALSGVDNTLSEEIQSDRYKLWLFNGCRTEDYHQPIANEARSNAQLKSENLDLFTTNETLYWQNISSSLLAFMDGVMAEDGSPDLSLRLQNANPEQAPAITHRNHGFEDNPRQR